MKRKPNRIWQLIVFTSLIINAWQLWGKLGSVFMDLPLGKKAIIFVTWHFGRFLSNIGI